MVDDEIIDGVMAPRKKSHKSLIPRPGHPEVVNVPEEEPGRAWKPKGGEIFVYSMMNDIADPPGMPDPDPEVEALGFELFMRITDLRRSARKAGGVLGTDELVAALKADPVLGPRLGLTASIEE